MCIQAKTNILRSEDDPIYHAFFYLFTISERRSMFEINKNLFPCTPEYHINLTTYIEIQRNNNSISTGLSEMATTTVMATTMATTAVFISNRLGECSRMF